MASERVAEEEALATPAHILRKNPNAKWPNDRGNERQRAEAELPWFWAADAPNTERANDVRMTTTDQRAARDTPKPKGAKP